MAAKRKLAAILAADVVGFSRLTGTDEDRTLARLRAHIPPHAPRLPRRSFADVASCYRSLNLSGGLPNLRAGQVWFACQRP
jgi:hypothetical protein